jgi:hypothetical protein
VDPDPGGQKLPTKIDESKEVYCFEVPDVALFDQKKKNFQLYIF